MVERVQKAKQYLLREHNKEPDILGAQREEQGRG